MRKFAHVQQGCIVFHSSLDKTLNTKVTTWAGMAKIVYLLAISASFVFCEAGKILDRDAFMLSKNEYCSAKCDVVKCPKVTRCTKDQNDCGLEEPDPIHGEMCEESSICVPKDCNCK